MFKKIKCFFFGHEFCSQSKMCRRCDFEFPEKIVCSAINISDGKTFFGLRHCDCFNAMKIAGIKPGEFGRPIQGFLTTKNRFVDRKTAAVIAYRAKQIKRLDYYNQTPKLYSEDLY